ncbi:superoxide dismutase [uncultured Agrococcus sp.]|uniref:superoxide dismutase n=1 Tax=uncultured Agrococcus sp. TaxID=382258 RepID=UPI0025D1F17A|nr:superoxide dismutase [uncultured Agrococcus sp.]
MTVYTLPELPYDYAALEPHISGKIMELHHDKHHKTYVDGANTALEALEAARESADFGSITKLEKDLAFHLGGHTNHTVFWNNLSPDGGGEPDGELSAALSEFFGDFEKFKSHFSQTATTIQGSGWSVLAWDSVGERLNVFQLFDQQGNVPVGTHPILMLDMWEHAFYLDYLNVKADYVKAFWQIVNWQDAAARLADARTKTAGLI